MTSIVVPRPPCALTIAGSDPSGGAGAPADLKTFARLGVYGLSVLTAVTAQDGRRVYRIEALARDLVEAQLDAALATARPQAVKIGMLGDAASVDAVVERSRRWGSETPIVLDPVLEASDGASLLDEESELAMRERLLPRATLITPNKMEAERLAGLEIASAADLLEAGRRIEAQGPSVLLKGGHGRGPTALDVLFHAGGIRRFERVRLAGPSPHGTGCVLSAAIAAYLAHGQALETAVERGIGYLVDLLERPFDLDCEARVLGAEGRVPTYGL